MITPTLARQQAADPQAMLDMACKAPIIAVMAGNSGIGKTTSAIFIALGLKQHGQNVFFLDLDETSKIPLLTPYDKTPDFVIMNCPAGHDDSVVACAEVATTRLLLGNAQDNNLSATGQLLENVSTGLNKALHFHYLTMGVADTLAGVELFNKLSASTAPLPLLCLDYWGFIPANDDIAQCTANGYRQQNVVPASRVFTSLVQKILAQSTSSDNT